MAATPKILLVDDEAELAATLADYLSLRGGFSVRTATDGAAMKLAYGLFRPDVVVLDLHLGQENGIDLADWLASEASEGMPGILFLSGAATPFDRIMGLEVHGDEFLDKPINPRELLASVRSLLRRIGRDCGRTGRLLRLGAAFIDLAAQSVIDAAGRETRLSPAEFALLKCFLDDPRRIHSRDALLDRAPASDEEASDRAVDRRIARLRRKLEGGGQPVIEAVRSLGYRLVLGALDNA
ncbi:response regulator transcription factor [Bosea sp. F3-2]|jgi:two-component system, OmpR family, response regulator|uniref:response regulator transcription factor n=1 Tax=Bosea sp. F3-2 TaxID=2599640 RepID=UPI0011EF5942|nr:response regulator transcription factor [Bosea sp. F3-2]QEL24755.1 response regulator transcription factor [Bosea sp. F3-2]